MRGVFSSCGPCSSPGAPAACDESPTRLLPFVRGSCSGLCSSADPALGAETARSHNPEREWRGEDDAETGMPSASLRRNLRSKIRWFTLSAIHTTYRISLRSSSLREPRYPLLRVVFGFKSGCNLSCRPVSASGSVRVGVGLASTRGKQPLAPQKCGARGPLASRPARPPQHRRGCLLKQATPPAEQGHAHSLSLPIKKEKVCGSTASLPVWSDRFNDPSAGSPTETLLRLLLPLGGRV